MNLRRFALALLLAGALAPSVAAAQEVSAGDKAAARQLTIDGHTALERKDYAAAAELFRRADTLFHAPTVTLGLARSAAGLGKLLAAQEFYNRLVHETLAPGASEVFVRAIDDGRAELAALSPRIPSLVIQVRGAVASRVTLDGVEVPAAVLGIKRPVEPGRHTIRALARGFKPSVAAVDVAEGSTESVALDFVAAPPGVSDGVDDAGPGAGRSRGAPQKTAGIVVLSAGAAGLAIGAVAGGIAAADHSNLIAQCGSPRCPSSQQSSVDGYHTAGAVSTGAFIAGGILAAAGVVVVLTVPKATVSPSVGLGFVGVVGSF